MGLTSYMTQYVEADEVPQLAERDMQLDLTSMMRFYSDPTGK